MKVFIVSLSRLWEDNLSYQPFDVDTVIVLNTRWWLLLNPPLFSPLAASLASPLREKYQVGAGPGLCIDTAPYPFLRAKIKVALKNLYTA